MAFSWCQLDILHNDSAHWLILLPTTDYGAYGVQCFLWSTLQKWWPIRRCHFCRVRTNFNISYNIFVVASFICLRSRLEFHATHEIRVGVASVWHAQIFLSAFFLCANFGCDCEAGVKMSCWHTFLRLHSINLFSFSILTMNRFVHSTAPSRNRYFCVIFIGCISYLVLLYTQIMAIR